MYNARNKGKQKLMNFFNYFVNMNILHRCNLEFNLRSDELPIY